MSELKKDITLVTGIGQMSTTLLGTGLFMVPAIAASIAGQHLLWAWVILLCAVCPIALTFAALGKRYPNAGGASYFVKKAFNSRLERAMAWLFISVMPVGVPAAVALAGGFAQQILPAGLSDPISAQLLTVLLLIVVNLAGTRSSSRLQTAIAIGIVGLVVAFMVKGSVGTEDVTLPKLTSTDFVPIGQALAVMFWCFVGIEAFAHMGEEFKNPQRDYPLAILLGCVIAGLVYWAFSVVVLKFGAYGTSELDRSSIPYIAQLLFGAKATLLISVMGFLACFATINLYTQSLSRMIWSQAREYKPQSPLAKLNRKGVPLNATLVVGVVLALGSVAGELSGIDLEVFLKLANGVFVVIYFMSMFAAIKLLAGYYRGLAFVASLVCLSVFGFLGWAMLYALGLFCLFWMVLSHSPAISEQTTD
jgi:amino acid efflux transporter